MQQNLLNKDHETTIFEQEISELLKLAHYARGQEAVEKLKSLAKTNPMVKRAVIEEAQKGQNAIIYILSYLAIDDKEAKNALIELAKKGDYIAIHELVNFPDDSLVKSTIIKMARQGNENARSVLDDLIQKRPNDAELKSAIFELSKSCNYYGIRGLAFLARSGDKDAKNLLFELTKELTDYAITEVYYWAYLGNEEARNVLFERAKEGNNAAINSLGLLASKNNKEALQLLLKLSTNEDFDEYQAEMAEYRSTFAIRELVNLLNEANPDNLEPEIVERIVNKLNEIGKSGDAELASDLRNSLESIKFDAYYLGRRYPSLEQLITSLVGKPSTGMSIYDRYLYDSPPTIVYKTTYTPYPEEENNFSRK